MIITARSYLTAGIAALGAGAIALSPVQPIPNHLAAAQGRAVSNLPVSLVAAAIDPFTPLEEMVKTSLANTKTLAEFYLQKPFPLLTTVVANLGTYAAELEAGDGNLIPDQIKGNIQKFFQAPWGPGAVYNFAPFLPPGQPDPLNIPYVPELGTAQYLSKTVPATGTSPADVYTFGIQILVGQSQDDQCQVDGSCLFVTAAPFMNLLNTPYSGQLIGLAGTLLSPLVQLVKSFTAVGAYFTEGDVAGAINELINIPTKTTNAFLNGAGFLDLAGIINKFLPEPLPDGTKAGLNLGGLLNSMPQDGSLVPPPVTDPPTPADPPTKWSVGVGFDSAAAYVPDFYDHDGLRNGFWGSTIGLGQFLSEELLVKPPVKSAAAGPAAAAAAAEAPAAVVADSPAPAVADDPAPVAVDIAAAVEAPALKAVSAPAPAKQSAASDNDGNGGGRGHHSGARGNNSRG